MNIRNLYFFDSNGYNLNFDWNKPDVASSILSDNKNYPTDESKDEALRKAGCYWVGYIYLPKVSVGLYTNTTIYVLEEVNGSYSFPIGNSNEKIVFRWDSLNKFVDEFFMFNFDENYIIKETSALIYTPNDGPDCNTLIINRFDEYEIPLETTSSSKALPIHIAFMANEKYDATTYNRTLIMSYNNNIIAKIKFFTETVEEDERLKIWNANLGYNITPEDEMIFYKSDIKEYMPDYKLLNEKRKELMMEGSNIYPFIGSYKAIINAIKFFGYENLNIIEFWRNVNPDDENFGKIYHSSKYSLKHRETLRIGTRNIVLPNKDYKKMNALALVYSINKITGNVDDWELPTVKEQFTYTIEEALIKLFALRKKLNKEFMPGTSRIIDIIGEANYFGIHGLMKISEEQAVSIEEKNFSLNFDSVPGKFIHITDNEYFNRYIKLRKYQNMSEPESAVNNLLLSDVFQLNVNELMGSQYSYDNIPQNTIISSTNPERCDYYKNYYREVFEDYTVYKAIQNNDDYSFDNEEYDYYGSPYDRFSAKVVLKNTTFSDNLTFEECDLKFDCTYSTLVKDSTNPSGYKLQPDSVYDDLTFENIEKLLRPTRIAWKIEWSKNQYDDDLRIAGKSKIYMIPEEIGGESEPEPVMEPLLSQYLSVGQDGRAKVDDYNEFFAQLPYIGYYDVTMELFTNSPIIRNGKLYLGILDTGMSVSDNDDIHIENGYWYVNGTNTNVEVTSQSKTLNKYIKVEPYQIDILGFYYDIRELPDDIKYDNPEDSVMYNFIQDNIRDMVGWAVSERTSQFNPINTSMPTYTVDGKIINTGPYFNQNVDDEWYLADNLTYEIGKLLPLVKYTRYIRSGVDVKPYTWFLLSYEFSKIAGKVKPKWTITNNTTGTSKSYPATGYTGRYLTLLLKKEGNYTVTLSIEDKNGNVYTTTRNIIVVSKTANYNIYQPFKRDYDYMVEEDMLKQLNEFYYSDKLGSR